MANVYTVKGNQQHVDRPFDWHVYEVKFTEVTNGADFDVALDTLPIGTKILDARLLVVTAEVGAADSAGGIVVVGSADQELVAVTSDINVNTVYTSTAAECGQASLDLVTAARALVFRSSRGAGAVTTPPVLYCAVLMGRVEY